MKWNKLSREINMSNVLTNDQRLYVFTSTERSGKVLAWRTSDGRSGRDPASKGKVWTSSMAVEKLTEILGKKPDQMSFNGINVEIRRN
jgi:hypothetical protein